jgi:hypothetical protein
MLISLKNIVGLHFALLCGLKLVPEEVGKGSLLCSCVQGFSSPIQLLSTYLRQEASSLSYSSSNFRHIFLTYYKGYN